MQKMNFYFNSNTVYRLFTPKNMPKIFLVLLESRDTGLSVSPNVNLSEIVIKLTGLLGCKVRNEKRKFKMLLVTIMG